MKLFEEFKLYENMWDSKPLQESYEEDAYKALMDVQGYINDMPGWKVVDCVSDAEDIMTLKCSLEDGFYIWYEPEDDFSDYEYTEDVNSMIDYAEQRQVSVDFEENSDDTINNYYDVRVYLHYRPMLDESLASSWREYEITYSFDSDPAEIHTDIMAAKIGEDEDQIIDRFFDSLFDSGYNEDVDGVAEVIDIKPL